MKSDQLLAAKPKVILLDVYETILDMTEMERKVNHLLDSKRGFTIWFELLLQYCFADNCTGEFHTFNEISAATMSMAAKALGEKIATNNVTEVLELLKHLPLKEGVQDGLSALHDQGFRLGALTNTFKHVVAERMDRTGLISYFETVLSAEQIKNYKPAKAVYQWAAENMKVPISDILMVSSHGWDIAGSAHAGMQTAYVKVKNQMLYPLAPQPTFIATNLMDLATQLHSKYSL